MALAGLYSLFSQIYSFICDHAMTKHGFNPLPDDKILDWSKLKQIAKCHIG